MGRQLNLGKPRAKPEITITQKLLTGDWTADVAAVETAIRRFKADGPLAGACHVVFFEIAGDDQLHVNVTHQHPMAVVRGWAGPGRLPDGFVHNRRFGDMPQSEVVRHILDMVFAVPDSRAGAAA